VGTGRFLRVSNIHLSNTTNAAVTIDLCLCASPDPPTAANALLWQFSLGANDFLEFGEGLWLPPGSSLQGGASAGSAIALFLSGHEILGMAA
jgi:hypothetical protein